MIVSSWSVDKNALVLEMQNTTWPPRCGVFGIMSCAGKRGTNPLIRGATQKIVKNFKVYVVRETLIDVLSII